MNFNVDKCAVRNTGHNNIQHNYTMANQQLIQLIATEEQRDPGTTTTKDPKWLKQTEKSCKKANRVLNSLWEQRMLPLYKSRVRPHLEYAVQFWSPHLRIDIDKIESAKKSYKNDSRDPNEIIATNNVSRPRNSLASYK